MFIFAGQKIDIELIRMETQNIISITGTKLLGTLTFVIDDKDENKQDN